MARLEGSGVLFLRSLCRLTHVGHAQYYKGDGHAFHDYLEKHYPGTFLELALLLEANRLSNDRCNEYMRGQGRTLEASRLVA